MRDPLLRLVLCVGCASLIVIFSSSPDGVSLQRTAAWLSRGVGSASVFFTQSISAAKIQKDYSTPESSSKRRRRSTGEAGSVSDGKIYVLIVPGHQPDAGGTVFKGVYEREIVVDIAQALAELLERNRHYDVTVARGKAAWDPLLQNYFDTHSSDIWEFEREQASKMKEYLASGSIRPQADQVYHNSTSPKGALQLYGINKWVSENEYDIVLHLHINDYGGRRKNTVGKYDGFTIYVPEKQYSNAAASRTIGEAIAARLNAYHATSTLPQEAAGVVEDQELIAIGANNTVDSAALLIEYGYIYEPQFQKASVRPVAITDYAYQTYLGLQDFFNDAESSTSGSIAFPYDWTRVSGAQDESGPGVYALQAALHRLGYYPPATKAFNVCPISGISGPCTKSAIEGYQRARGLDVVGTLGPQTRTALDQDLATP